MASLAGPDASTPQMPIDTLRHKKTVATPARPVRPRTRSSVLKAARASPKTRLKRRNRGLVLREDSPVVDLTEDEVVEEESPLKQAAARRARLLDPEVTIVADESETSETNEKESDDKERADAQLALVPVKTAPEPEKRPMSMFPQPRLQVELDLSPIKKLGPGSPRRLAAFPMFLSSPSKKRKSVMFSDKVAQEVPSSPLEKQLWTPKRSILKPPATNEDSSPMDPNNSAMWVKTARSLLHQFSTECNSPNNPAFWLPGTIIQLELRSNDLPQLVDGCLEVLRDVNFDRKFEAYATLNLVCKLNDFSVVAELFTGEGSGWLQQVEKATGYTPKSIGGKHLQSICLFVRRDMELIESQLFATGNHPKLSPSKIDPFRSRTLNQALKVISQLLSITSVNTSIPVADVKWFYSHTCETIIHPKLSKSLTLPYLTIIKDCHFSPKKRRQIFEANPNPILEKMLFALLNMRSFLSSSLINEKFNAMTNLIQNFPAIMAKNFHHWFPGLMLNLCDISFALYTKVVNIGVTTLLEAARSYLDNNDVCLAARHILESAIPSEQKSCMTENLISMASPPRTNMIEYVIDSLKDLIDNGQFKHAMDIWVGVTLLLGNFKNGIENWTYLNAWLHVHKFCFNGKSINAKETALSSWKVIVYKICCFELRGPKLTHLMPTPGNDILNTLTKSPNVKQMANFEEALRPKVKLLIHPFVSKSLGDLERPIVEAFHHCFLSILFNLLNYQPKTTARYLHIFWDKIIQPILVNFYFKKDGSSQHMHHLGLGIINKLLKPSAPINEKCYSSLRCLSNEPISLSEINSLSPRWVHLRFEKLLPMLVMIFKLDKLESRAKLNSFNSFVNTLKFVTKKEVLVSDATYDLIDNLPITLEKFFERNKILYEDLFKLIVNLNDTFGAAYLIGEDDPEEIKSVYEVLLSRNLDVLTPHQLNAILSMLYGAIGEKGSLHFLLMLARINKRAKRDDLFIYIGDSLNNRKAARFSQSELVTIGNIFQYLNQNFAGIAKKLIQHIVLLKADEFDTMVTQLHLSSWNIQVFKFFVALMHDAPFDHLKQTNLKLIEERLKSEDDFADLLLYLIDNEFDYEISASRVTILSMLKDSRSSDSCSDIEGRWRQYLKNFNGGFELLDTVLLAAKEAGHDVSELVQNRWDKLPQLKALWLQENGKLHWDSVLKSIDSSAEMKVTPSIEIEAVSELDFEQTNPTRSQQDAAHELRSSLKRSSYSSELNKPSPSSTNEAGVDKADVAASSCLNVNGKNTFGLTSLPSQVIEISSDDIPMDPIEQARLEADEARSEEQRPSYELADQSSASQRDNFDVIQNSDASHENQQGRNLKRDFPDTDSSMTKRARPDFKEICDSEDSAKDKAATRPDLPDLEIASSSEERQSQNSSLSLLSQLSIQGQSTIVNTSTNSVDGTHSTLKKQLSVVEERPEERSEGVFHKVQKLLGAVGEEELAILNPSERYQLETQMLLLMVRMRSTQGEGLAAKSAAN